MRNITKTLIALLGIVAFSCSTDDVEDRPNIAGIDSAVLVAPEEGSLYVLTQNSAANQAERFVWTDANYDGNVAVNYTVEMDLEGAGFLNPQSLGSSISGNQLAVTEETLNTAALTLIGAPSETPTNFEIRVKSFLGDTDSPQSIMYSNTVIITVTPFIFVSDELPRIFVVGNFLGASGYGADWTPGDAVPISASEIGGTDFEGYVYMNMASAEFKFLPTNTSFDGDFGDDGTFSGVLVQEGEVNAQLTGPGYFLIKADTALLTYAATPMEWGIIGSATPTGWDADTNMTYDPATKKWSIVIDLVGGQELKFRANDAWTINFGDSGADGSLEQDGSNIAVAASGTYTVVLDLSTPREYTYSVTLN